MDAGKLGPSLHLLQNCGSKAAVLADQKDNQVLLGGEPVDALALLQTVQQLANPDQESCRLEFSGAEVALRLTRRDEGGPTTDLAVVNPDGSKVNIESVIVEPNPDFRDKTSTKPCSGLASNRNNIFVVLGPQAGLNSVIQGPSGTLTWE